MNKLYQMNGQIEPHNYVHVHNYVSKWQINGGGDDDRDIVCKSQWTINII